MPKAGHRLGLGAHSPKGVGTVEGYSAHLLRRVGRGLVSLLPERGTDLNKKSES